MTTLPGVYAVPGAAWPGSIWTGDIIGASTPVPASPVLFALGWARNGSGTGSTVLTQPATSSPFVQVQVIAVLDGASYDPTSDPVAVAFVPEPAAGPTPNPTSGQWQAAAWEADAGPVYWASVLTGPAGVQPAAGAYRVAVQVTDGGAARVMWGPLLLVT